MDSLSEVDPKDHRMVFDHKVSKCCKSSSSKFTISTAKGSSEKDSRTADNP